MLYLGIDIGKRNHVASMLDENGKPVFRAFTFSNTIEGAESLLEKLECFGGSVSTVTIGMEATGHYWLSIYSFLAEHHFMIHVINPIQTDGWRKGTEIRKRKTDIIDSVLIADLMRYATFMETSLANEDVLSLKNFSRFRAYLVSSISDLKRKVICVLDQVFPQYESIFSDIFGQTSQELLLHFQTAEDFESITAEQLEEALEQVTFKKQAREKAKRLSVMASNSFGVKFCQDSFSLQLKLLIQQIQFIESQVSEIDQAIQDILGKMDSPLLTIPGIGPVTGACILGEIGDISRFSNAAKLAAYAGIDASVSQSGSFQSTNNRMSKRGSPYLRKALFQAALVAAFRDPTFSAFYQKKRAEGKHHLTAIGAVARKLCNVMFAVLKNDEPYRSQNP